jgi:hypothetical protein
LPLLISCLALCCPLQNSDAPMCTHEQASERMNVLVYMTTHDDANISCNSKVSMAYSLPQNI